MVINPIKLRDNGFSDEMIRYFMDVQYDPDLPMGNVAISKVLHPTPGKAARIFRKKYASSRYP